MRVDVTDLQACRTDDELDALVDSIMAKATRDDPPFLSDLIVGIQEGAQPLMIALGQREKEETDLPPEQRLRWKIQVLCDEWGNKPQPGDIVTRKIQKNLYKRDGMPVGGNVMSRAKIDGSYDRRFVKRIEFKVDKRGCIECGFDSAVYFLNHYGVHAKTGYGMPHGKPQNTKDQEDKIRRELGGLAQSPDGQLRHVWYWRYKEMDKADYAALPKIKKNNEPKRGYDIPEA